MRISSLEADPGFQTDAKTGRYSVHLDGAAARAVWMADTDRGEIGVIALDEQGNAKFDVAADDFVRETRSGKVEIYDKGTLIAASA